MWHAGSASTIRRSMCFALRFKDARCTPNSRSARTVFTVRTRIMCGGLPNAMVAIAVGSYEHPDQELHSKLQSNERGFLIRHMCSEQLHQLSAIHALQRAQKRVVVTGMGVVSSVGDELDTFFDNLCAGKSGISAIESFDVQSSEWSTKIAGEVKDFDPGTLVSKKMARRLDRSIMFTLVAGKKALLDAGMPLHMRDADLDPFRVGILVGSAMGGIRSFTDGCLAIITATFRKMNPFCIPFSITNMGGALLAMDTGCMGPNYSISTACATGNYCMLNGFDHIQRGEVDMMLVGAADAAIVPSGIGGFIACRALSKRNDDPAAASRPWDQGRDGFVMGEGAGVLVIEELEHAQKRGAKIYAELLGGAMTCDAHHMTEPKPDGSGVAACIQLALQKCGVTPSDVHYVNAHATSTSAGDMAEYRAITSAVPSSECDAQNCF